jgi:hypothetical protein
LVWLPLNTRESWHATDRTRKYLGIIGIAIFTATLFGFGKDFAIKAKAFFGGMSLGMLPGLILSAWWRWDRFKPKLQMIAKVENVQWLQKLLNK